MLPLPFSQAAENNREPILAQLRELLADARSVLEIGAGTGQHAEYFAAQFPQLRWTPTEHPDALDTLRPRCSASALPNLQEAQTLDVYAQPWDITWPDALYTANTLHIMARSGVEALFSACAQAPVGSLLIAYGPFNYNGAYTSPSNESFDAWLKERDSRSGIRDFEWVDELAGSAGYRLQRDAAMPANNRLLCWKRGV